LPVSERKSTKTAGKVGATNRSAESGAGALSGGAIALRLYDVR
jgi:hypothetical protein